MERARIQTPFATLSSRRFRGGSCPPHFREYTADHVRHIYRVVLVISGCHLLAFHSGSFRCAPGGVIARYCAAQKAITAHRDCRLGPRISHHFQRSVTIVAPHPPASPGASRKSATMGDRATTERTISRCTPMPRPCMMRNALKPSRCASMRYSSTTAFTSRGGTLCRSKTSEIGMRMGSGSMPFNKPAEKSKARPAEADRADITPYAHLMLSDPLGPVLTHDRFHLIFQAKFTFLQSLLLQLLVGSQMRKRFQSLQLAGVFRVLAGKPGKLLICSHQMRFQFFLCIPFHIRQFLPVRLPRRAGRPGKAR